MTQERRVDVFVVGLGAMGSATLWQLARRGVRAAGADRFTPPHALGSSHGRSRIIRKAYYEHPDYVPLVLHAYDLWESLQDEAGVDLLTRTGGLMIGPEDGEVVQGSLESARRHGLPHELLTATEVERRFPAFRLARDERAVYEPDAGVVQPEKAIEIFLAQAQRLGAEVRTGTPVLAVEPAGDGVVVRTATGPYRADRVVLSAGAWTPAFWGAARLQVERQVMHWFRGLGPAFAHPALPVFLYERKGGRTVYSLPDMGEGWKLAFHHGGQTTTADTVDRGVQPEEGEELVQFASALLPALQGARPAESVVCMYTNTPDRHFALGAHPELTNVFVAAGFSGHGFKFAPAIGDVMAALALGEQVPFRLDRFAPARLVANEG